MKILIEKEKVDIFLRDHKLAHIRMYSEAMKGWEELMSKYTNELKNWAIAGGIQKDRPVEPYKPVSYVKEYDELMDMLSYHIEKTITLDQSDFDQIVKDEFGWSNHFVTSNSVYVTTARQQQNDSDDDTKDLSQEN